MSLWKRLKEWAKEPCDGPSRLGLGPRYVRESNFDEEVLRVLTEAIKDGRLKKL